MYFKGKFRIFLILILLSLTLLSYFSIRTYVYDIPEIPNVPKDGRVNYYQFPSSNLTNEEELLKGFYTVIYLPGIAAIIANIFQNQLAWGVIVEPDTYLIQTSLASCWAPVDNIGIVRKWDIAIL